LSKQLTCQKYIFKLRSSRLRKSRWKLTLPLFEARKNDELVSLADSQVLRWIDQLNGVEDGERRARDLKRQIRALRKESDCLDNRRQIKKLYEQLDALQFQPDYMCLVIDKEKDYHRACRGFTINGVAYERLLGTNGGIKNETIVFVSKRLAPELKRRIENGRDPECKLVPAKLEAYKALTCSASIPVSMPNGVIVVNDCETKFISDIIYMNDEGVDEPVMEYRPGVEVDLDESDGYGIMLPSLAERWGGELGIRYLPSGVNTRFCWEKGMVYTFDFLDFAEKVAGSYIVKDAWGVERDVRNAELILTTSMVKLWDSYKSCEHYLQCCIENGYTFGIAKTCPEALESEHALNYQFIQSYDLSDQDILQLTDRTVREIQDVLFLDPVKTVLFSKGVGLNDSNVRSMRADPIKALMIEPYLLNDPYIQNVVYQAIRNRITNAKVGVLNVHGNYSMVSGDPYALCQSIFGLAVTGLLKSGEIYNKYWADSGSPALACFRAPMTCHNNIRRVIPCRSPDAYYWYRYMPTATVFNAWDTAAHALNGMDKDGDLVMLTDDPVLVGRLKPLPALMCVQRKAPKKIVTEEDLISSNIASFGDDIGKTTNWITSMFEVQANFEPGSPEWEVLEYRIRCGQLYQQNSIDKAKGIVAQPMPKSWHDWHAASAIEDPVKRQLYLRILADRKPYFMRYIYPDLMRDYNKFVKNTDKHALREFGMTVSELTDVPEDTLTDAQKEFLHYYNRRLPVGPADCVMNRICRMIENVFDGSLVRFRKELDEPFDYTILKSGDPYKSSQYYKVLELYEEYNRKLQAFKVYQSRERVEKFSADQDLRDMKEAFVRECSAICSSSSVLCDIVLDICYKRSSTKKFAWDICGEQIVENLLKRCGGSFSYPSRSADGDIMYGGMSFSMRSITMEVEE
jgi:hypothetical protein